MLCPNDSQAKLMDNPLGKDKISLIIMVVLLDRLSNQRIRVRTSMWLENREKERMTGINKKSK